MTRLSYTNETQVRELRGALAAGGDGFPRQAPLVDLREEKGDGKHRLLTRLGPPEERINGSGEINDRGRRGEGRDVKSRGG